MAKDDKRLTGLFGHPVSDRENSMTAGPGGAILAYLLIGIMLYFLMSSIGELATFYPVSGSFSSYATRFVDPSLGFTMGWLYYIMWALVSSVDVMVASNVLYYWDIFKFFSPLTWSLIFITIVFLLNIFTVKAFGETEFWLSLVKVVTIIIFIIVGFLMIFGILGSHTYGFENYTKGEAPFVGGLSGFLGVLLVAGFSVGGTEFVADNNDVNITALITEAAKATPILSNTIVKGLCVTDSFSFNNNGSV